MSSFQPGGPATIVCSDWVSRVIDRGEVPYGLGRWSFLTLRGKAERKITIITAYNASLTADDKTFYTQQLCTLSRLHRQHKQNVIPNPKKQFILDLQSWIEHLQAKYHEIILSLDANDTYDPDAPGLSHPLP
jgi:hypothetical protein